MTSELKPDYEGFSLEICQIAFYGSDASGDTIQEIGLKHGVLREEQFNSKDHANVVNAEYFEEGQTVYCFAASRATPSADTLAGLVRYDVSSLWGRTISCVGEYALYSEAAAVVAAKDVEIEELKNILASTTSCKKMMTDQAAKNAERAKTAEAELAQIKAQEPVGTLSNVNGLLWYAHGQSDGDIPLYAAPVSNSLKAENERLREAAQAVVERWDTPKWKDQAPTAEVINCLRAALNVEANDDKG